MKNEVYEIWFDQWIAWRSGQIKDLPPKPNGFDMWLMGDNPLKLQVGEGKLEPLVAIPKSIERSTPNHNFQIQLEFKLNITPNDTPHAR